MKNIIFLTILLLFNIKVKCQVGINTTTPSPSSVLDITSATKGALFPQYDLTLLNSTSTPVSNPVDGLMIYNKGGASTFPKGYYIWIKNSWQRTIIKGSEPQIMALNIIRSSASNATLIPVNSSNNAVPNLVVTTNKIDGASLGADQSTITLPAGTYVIKYSVDCVRGDGDNTANTKYFDKNFTCTRSYLINASSNTSITEQNRMCELSDTFTFFQGTFYLTLTAPTAIKQKFEFDSSNGLTSSSLDIRSSFTLVITRMTQ